MPAGALVVALLSPHQSGPLLERLAARRVSALAMERVPRITRAQSMDALSSQATVAGYKAVLLGAAALPRILPMMTTAAGTLAPAKAFVLGAGVAGLQAIATARRLGAVVSAFDVRAGGEGAGRSPSARPSSRSRRSQAEGAGGYAKELARPSRSACSARSAAHVKDMDLVITTAQIPGKPRRGSSPATMVRSMKPGSVIVDLAAETGGNCELTRPGETVVEAGVTVLGPLNLPPRPVPRQPDVQPERDDAARSTSRKDGQLAVDPDDEITGRDARSSTAARSASSGGRRMPGSSSSSSTSSSSPRSSATRSSPACRRCCTRRSCRRPTPSRHLAGRIAGRRRRGPRADAARCSASSR